MDVRLSKRRETLKGREARVLQLVGPRRVGHDWAAAQQR